MRRRAQAAQASGGRGEAARSRPSPAPFASRAGRGLRHVRPRWRRSYGERVREGEAGRGASEATGRRRLPGPRGCARSHPRPTRRSLCPSSRRVTAGPGPPRAAWGAGSARRRPPLPLVPPVPSRPVPSGVAGRVPMRVGGSGDVFGLLVTVPAALPHPVAGPAPGCRM